MKLEHLKFFVTAAEYGSITVAANALYISPQGLSQAIRSLERELGAVLFYRERNRMLLTAAGEAAYRVACEITELNGRMLREVQAARPGEDQTDRDSLVILAPPSACVTFLPKIFNQFLKRCPGVKFQVLEASHESIFQCLPGRVIDWNTLPLYTLPRPVFDEFAQASPIGGDFVELHRCPLMAAVSAKSPLAKKERLTQADFLEHSLVMFYKDEEVLHQIFPGEVFPNILLRTANLSMCRSVIEHNPNVIGFTHAIAEQALKNTSICAVPMEPAVDITVGYILTAENRGNPLIASLIELLRSYV